MTSPSTNSGTNPGTNPGPSDLLLPADSALPTRPLWLVRPSSLDDLMQSLTPAQAQWLRSLGFRGAARKFALLPAADGSIAGAVLGLGEAPEKPGTEPSVTFTGLLPALLPPGAYHLATESPDAELASIAYGLGAYRFRRYKSGDADPQAQLKLPANVTATRVKAIVEAVTLGRDLINTPSNDMGPAELEAAARALAARHGATVTSIVGDDLLAQNFPLIHAVGRASPRAPRLIEIRAGRADAPKVTLVGKGICFDTGGLDIKPSSGMLIMKKDMGGAATALAIAHMILATRLDVRLRVLLPTAENSIAGNAFRPGDVIRSRAGRTVEIGNTDAEGRLVLADALSLADEERPDQLLTFATLTGAARVAVGADFAPYYTDDADLARAIEAAGSAVADPVWRMPLATPYDGLLDSPVADMNNVSEGGFAGSIIAAIFLKRFVSKAHRFAHFDIYGWRQSAKPLGPKGGETNAARAVFEMLRRQYGRA